MDHAHLRLRALELACDHAQIWTNAGMSQRGASPGSGYCYVPPAEIVARAQAFLDFLDPPVVEKCAPPAAFASLSALGGYTFGADVPKSKPVRRKAAAKPARAKRGTRQQKAAVKLRATARKAVRK